MNSYPLPRKNTRLGFHYFPDTFHYRESDLIAWVPELSTLGASWLTLIAPAERAIPEPFISGLLASGIEPILHFNLPLEARIPVDALRLLFETYAGWGVHYVALFDRPNARSSWSPAAWAQSDLVERFLDLYIPAAETALRAGLIPVFPPLEPGGDYWDTSFLRGALRGIRRRGHTRLLSSLVLGAYAWNGDHPLNWGAGGPERWPGARPYITPPGVEDQTGFRIFDWYMTIAGAELGDERPVLLLKAGDGYGGKTDPSKPAPDNSAHTQRNLAVAQHMMGGPYGTHEQDGSWTDPVPSAVLACNFWLLCTDPGSPFAAQAWFQPDGSQLPSVRAMRQWMENVHFRANRPQTKSIRSFTKSYSPATTQPDDTAPAHPIAHYLLLPVPEWGVAEWQLETVRPFVDQYHPTVGYSLAEASLATRVTVVGGVQAFSEEDLGKLRASGCRVERIIRDGTLIAT